MTVVECNYKGLSYFPLAILVNVRCLSLRNNVIKSVSAASFQNISRLESLLLEGNLISTLGDKSFSGLMDLQILNIKRNMLSILLSRMFIGLSILIELDLSDNHLEKVCDGAFAGLIHVKKLDLSSNDITFLSPEAFLDLHSLNILDLHDNKLRLIPNLIYLQNLQMLSLRNNYLDSTHVQVWQARKVYIINIDTRNGSVLGVSLCGAESVRLLNRTTVIEAEIASSHLIKFNSRTINPSSNQLKNMGYTQLQLNIQAIDFRCLNLSSFMTVNTTTIAVSIKAKILPRLRKLDLSSNSKIKTCLNNSFFLLKGLRELCLSKTSLAEVECDCFAGLRSLEKLGLFSASLLFTSFQTAQCNVFKPLKNPKVLKIGKNKINRVNQQLLDPLPNL
jgi:Leucine-rich repeat (LRR) protein